MKREGDDLQANKCGLVFACMSMCVRKCARLSRRVRVKRVAKTQALEEEDLEQLVRDSQAPQHEARLKVRVCAATENQVEGKYRSAPRVSVTVRIGKAVRRVGADLPEDTPGPGSY